MNSMFDEGHTSRCDCGDGGRRACSEVRSVGSGVSGEFVGRICSVVESRSCSAFFSSGVVIAVVEPQRGEEEEKEEEEEAEEEREDGEE
mmetsp:Transcript_25317/g.81851  ORF Transcript_25317/g.81851 Transcript_25317/m.81851 type:complete len:89 (+) Transcript_25317:564-830(+)